MNKYSILIMGDSYCAGSFCMIMHYMLERTDFETAHNDNCTQHIFSIEV